MHAQDLGADRMERAEPRHRLLRTGEHGDALTHLARSLVGEGHRQNFMRARPACRNDMRDASGEDAGFPHACASKNENGTVKRLDRPPLLVVQPLEVRRISIVRATDERRWPSCFARRRRDDRRFGYF